MVLIFGTRLLIFSNKYNVQARKKECEPIRKCHVDSRQRKGSVWIDWQKKRWLNASRKDPGNEGIFYLLATERRQVLNEPHLSLLDSPQVKVIYSKPRSLINDMASSNKSSQSGSLSKCGSYPIHQRLKSLSETQWNTMLLYRMKSC